MTYNKNESAMTINCKLIPACLCRQSPADSPETFKTGYEVRHTGAVEAEEGCTRYNSFKLSAAL